MSRPVTPFRHSAVSEISPTAKVKNIPATLSVPKDFCRSPRAARECTSDRAPPKGDRDFLTK